MAAKVWQKCHCVFVFIGCNPILITGVLACPLKAEGLGVPAKVAKIIRIKVSATCIFNFQGTSERLRFEVRICPFTYLHKGWQNAHPKSPLFRKKTKKFF